MLHRACATGTEIYVNANDRWHITVFHTSQFDDTRPNPMEPADSDLQQTESGKRPLPSADLLRTEQQPATKVVGQNQPINLEVHCSHLVSVAVLV